MTWRVVPPFMRPRYDRVMATVTTIKRVTFEEFCRLVPDGQKADLIDGVIYMASPDSTDNNEIIVWLCSLLFLFVLPGRLGKVYVNRVAYRLEDEGAPEPDVSFVAAVRAGQIKKGFVAGGPDLAIEVVSEESVERDYELKVAQYEEAGVPEYWIVDPLREKVTLLRLDRKGRYRPARRREGWFESKVLEGFRLRPEWLWQNPLPDPRDALEWMHGDA